MAERWSPEPAMVRRATGSSPTDGQIPRTDTGGLTSLAQRFALNDQRNRPVFISSLTYTRARGARAAAAALGWLMAERWSPEPAMVRRATGSSPTDGQIPRTDTGGLTSLAQRFALNDQRNRPVFISSLTYTRAREARAAAAALGWLMAERWSPEPAMVRRATGHRQPMAKFRALTLGA